MSEPGDERINNAARALIAKVNSTAVTQRIRSDDAHTAMAAACLHRAASLIDEALDLAARPQSSLGANVLTRAAFECWVMGVWALFGEMDAVLGINEYRIKQETLMAKANNVPQAALDHLAYQLKVIEESKKRHLGGRQPKSVKFEQMAKRVGAIIKEKNDEDADALMVYDIMYRTHSTYDAHPAQPTGQLLVADPEQGPWRVEPRGPWTNPVTAAGMMSMYIGILGRWIDEDQGGSDPEWNELVLELLAAVDERKG